jgi:hypothetical protein
MEKRRLARELRSLIGAATKGSVEKMRMLSL